MPTLGWWVLGALSPWLWPGPPPACFPLMALAIAGLSTPLRRTRCLALFALGAGWVAWHAGVRLERRLVPPPASTPPALVSGTIASLPVRHGDLVQFRFAPDAENPGLPESASTRGVWLVRWRGTAKQPRVGERWRLPVRLRPARSRVNFAGTDPERWYFAEDISALGTVSGSGAARLGAAAALDPRAWRQGIRDSLARLLAGRPGSGLVLALAVADRSGLDRQTRADIRATGTGHLLAISGLHVGLVALFVYWLARGLLTALPHRLRPDNLHLPALWCGVSVAVAYGTLAGMGTSTRRALIMLGVFAACASLRRPLSPWSAWWAALGLVILLDPCAPLQAGFWLSFTAVGALLAVWIPRTATGQSLPGRLLRAQFAITLALAPLGLYWFQVFVPGGLPVNLVAIPWVSLVTLPLVLLGMACLAVGPVPAEGVLDMAARSAHWAELAITAAARLLNPVNVHLPAPGPFATAVALAGAFMLLLPAGLRLRWFSLPLLSGLLLPAAHPVSPGGFTLELLDVGQGLAALVRTRHRSVLYDSGPGVPGEWDLYASVIAPALAPLGPSAPDLVMISHGDLDHSGGLDSLRRYRRDSAFLVNTRTKSPGECHTGYAWHWDGVRFRILHPSPWLPYLGNDSSCVLGVWGRGAALLLPGDIGAVVERRLARGPPMHFELLLAPHHGSRSSTSAELLDWARPRRVLISAGAGNRFGFPHREVTARLKAVGASVWNTADCGAIEVAIGPAGAVTARSARRARPAAWRWPAAPECP